MSYSAMNHHKRMAEECCQQGRLNEAERYFLSAIQAAQSSSAYLVERVKAAAIFYLALGEYSKAEPQFERLLEIERTLHGPGSFPICRALVYKAVFFYRAGRYTDAKPCLDEALAVLRRAPYQRQPQFDARLHYFCLHLLGMVHGALGDAEAARKHCQEAAQVVGRNAGPGGNDLRSAIHQATLKHCNCHSRADSRATCEWLLRMFLDQLQRELLSEVITHDPKPQVPAAYGEEADAWVRELFLPHDDEWRPAAVHRGDSPVPSMLSRRSDKPCFAAENIAWRA